MPPIEPPDACPGTPRIEELRPGSVLWRVHTSAREPHAMNPTAQASAEAGGRFDCLAGDYAYLYAADSPEAAIAETICRDLRLGDGLPRLIPRARVRGRLLSALRVTDPQQLVVVHCAGLTHLGQDIWLTKSAAVDYLLTRRWAAAIRRWVPDADGFVYRCRHDEDLRAWMLTTDPTVATHPALIPVGEPLPLDLPQGRALLRRILANYNAALDG